MAFRTGHPGIGPTIRYDRTTILMSTSPYTRPDGITTVLDEFPMGYGCVREKTLHGVWGKSKVFFFLLSYAFFFISRRAFRETWLPNYYPRAWPFSLFMYCGRGEKVINGQIVYRYRQVARIRKGLWSIICRVWGIIFWFVSTLSVRSPNFFLLLLCLSCFFLALIC
ncbi:hypothetical protein GGS20DRAFT_4229 [Poronia punctata]|nr:hypothetical protein GGS20DRAFT_4229 [Poronia punctata]